MSGAAPVDIGDNTPLRLAEAVDIAFPRGGMTVSGLRREIARGRLIVEVIAGKQFVTLAAIQEMREQCRGIQKAQGCGSSQNSVPPTRNSSARPVGSSVTERSNSALAALKATAAGLNKPSQTTSRANTRRRETVAVIHLKS